MKKILFYLKIWWLMSRNSFISVLYTKVALIIFLSGKIIRFTFFIVFILFLVKGTGNIGGFNSKETVFFFLTFNTIDVVSQFLFREVYRFRQQIISGNFDLIMVKPINPLFRSLLGGADFIDLITIPPLIISLIYLGQSFNPDLFKIILYLMLLVNGLIIAAAFHIAVLALAVLTLEIDATIMIYRDLVSLGRFPIEIYKEPFKSFLTYLIPIGLMISLPAKTLFTIVNPLNIIYAFIFSAGVIYLSIRFWNYSLTKYTSASS